MVNFGARRAFLWQLIAKNRKRRLALHTALRTGYQRRQLLLQVALDRALVSEQQWSNGLKLVWPPLATQCWLVYQSMVHLQRETVKRDFQDI